MIVKETVLILGAGASQPYGFPTGVTLANEICQALRDPTEAASFRDRLMRDFNIDNPPRIGAFLKMIKAAMIERLAAREHQNRLFPDVPENRNRKTIDHPAQDWYQYLFEHMRSRDAEQFGGNKLRVITFNFDRSFEYRLFLTVRGSYGLADQHAAELATTVPVLHVHGCLGEPAWLGATGSTARAYTQEITLEQKRRLLRKIRIIHEEIEQDVLDKAHAWLTWAHTICFIGFGYHPTNIGRLRMNERHPNAVIWGSTKGFTGVVRERIKASLHRDDDRRLEHDKSALDFLREAAVLQTDRV
jgi:hypothetical protein